MAGANRLPITNRLLRLRDVLELTGLSRSSLYQRMNDGRFPPAVRVGDRAIRWRGADIQAWQDQLSRRDSHTER